MTHSFTLKVAAHFQEAARQLEAAKSMSPLVIQLDQEPPKVFEETKTPKTLVCTREIGHTGGHEWGCCRTLSFGERCHASSQKRKKS